MSRIGNRVLKIPANVELNIAEQQLVIKGPLGAINLKRYDQGVLGFVVNENALKISRKNEQKKTKMLHGTYNALVNNAFIGVTKGFEKKLRLVGVGYRANVDGNKVNLALGYSHSIQEQIPEGIKVKVDKNTEITISGINKEEVGKFATELRKWRPPEPYKGKGVLYFDEVIIRKAGKTAEGKK